MDMEREIPKERFEEIYTDDELCKNIHFAHKCYDKEMNFKHQLALNNLDRFIVSKDQIKKATKQFKTRKEEILKKHKNDLIFISMGCDFEPKTKNHIGNHRIRAYFKNNENIKCFIEVGGQMNNLNKMSISATIHAGDRDKYKMIEGLRAITHKGKENYYYNNLHKRKNENFTYNNLLNLVNKEFNCNFKNIYVDKIILSSQDIEEFQYNK